MRCAAGVISPAHTAGVFHSIGSQHIVTPHSLWDRRGHMSFMKDKTTGAKSQTFSRRVESFTNTGELTNIYWIPSMCTARLSTTLPSKGGELRMANIPLSSLAFLHDCPTLSPELNLSGCHAGDVGKFQTDIKHLAQMTSNVASRISTGIRLVLF